MGNQVLTVPYQNVQSGVQPSPSQQAPPVETSGPPPGGPHSFMTMSAEIPSECPMHQAKKPTITTTTPEASSSSCPIKADSDINPANMVNNEI